MGVLLDTKFWGTTLNKLARLEPKLGETINKTSAAQICEIACGAFSTLVADPQFSVDLANAVNLAKIAPTIDATTPNFLAFVDSFMLLEDKILADAGVDSVASRDLDREIRAVAKIADAARLEGLEDKIRFLKKLACDPEAAANQRKPLWLAVWRGVKGVSLVGIDGGTTAASAVVLGPAGAAVTGMVAGYSVGYGAALIKDALKGRW